VSKTADWAAQRRRMVDVQLRRRGIRDARVLAAMIAIPREQFIPAPGRKASYDDEPAGIGHGQSISQPYMVALMAECLELKGTEVVLEVGAGSGYHAAVLGALADRVIAVEVIPELAEQARQNLDRTGYGRNVEVHCADGSLGWPGCEPYDAISVAAAAPEVPAALLDQLADPGRMVIPVGPELDQDLRVIARSGGKLSTRVATLCRFVPLRGRQGWK